MNEDELVQKVKKYLDSKSIKYYKDSIKYKCLRNVRQLDGSDKPYHLVSYMVSISEQHYDSDADYYVGFDEKSFEMKFILGPQSYEIISD
jgi:hypothetical protein